jgi:hypothetical protein
MLPYMHSAEVHICQSRLVECSSRKVGLSNDVWASHKFSPSLSFRDGSMLVSERSISTGVSDVVLSISTSK